MVQGQGPEVPGYFHKRVGEENRKEDRRRPVQEEAQGAREDRFVQGDLQGVFEEGWMIESVDNQEVLNNLLI